MELVLEKHIEKTSNVRSGKARITGTRITVSDVVLCHLRLGLSLEEIAVQYNLSLASVHAAMAYYFDNQDEIDTEIERRRLDYAQGKAAAPSRLAAALSTSGND
jgi:uncharacterized protein (DUF433 family)